MFRLQRLYRKKECLGNLVGIRETSSRRVFDHNIITVNFFFVIMIIEIRDRLTGAKLRAAKAVRRRKSLQ